MKRAEKAEKTYWLWGIKIERHPHYVNAYQHYDYKTMNKTFSSLEEAKNYIRESFGKFSVPEIARLTGVPVVYLMDGKQ